MWIQLKPVLRITSSALSCWPPFAVLDHNIWLCLCHVPKRVSPVQRGSIFQFSDRTRFTRASRRALQQQKRGQHQPSNEGPRNRSHVNIRITYLEKLGPSAWPSSPSPKHLPCIAAQPPRLKAPTAHGEGAQLLEGAEHTKRQCGNAPVCLPFGRSHNSTNTGTEICQVPGARWSTRGCRHPGASGQQARASAASARGAGRAGNSRAVARVFEVFVALHLHKLPRRRVAADQPARHGSQ